jgi:protein-tyrosine-phosphatase
VFRSPTSELMFKSILKENHLENRIRVDSAGLSDKWFGKTCGDAIPEDIIKEIENRDTRLEEFMHLKKHKIKTLDRQFVDKSNIIFVFERQQKNQIIQKYPEAKDKTFVIKEFAGHKNDVDIEDLKDRPLNEHLDFLNNMDTYLRESLGKIKDVLNI